MAKTTSEVVAAELRQLSDEILAGKIRVADFSVRNETGEEPGQLNIAFQRAGPKSKAIT